MRAYRFMSSGTPDYSVNADSRGWGPGYPTDRTGSMATFTVPTTLAGDTGGTHSWAQNGTQAFQVHYRVATLLHLILNEVQRRGYRLISGWCWGYEDRAIGAGQNPSNHSWGLAVDLNAPDDPISFDGIRYTDMPDWMPDLFASYGWAWGGDYVGAVHDSMHYEFMGTPDDATRATFAAGPALGHTPPPPPPPLLSGDDVLTIIESKEAGDHKRDPAVLRPDGTRGHPVGPDMWTAVNVLAKAGAAKIVNVPHTVYDAFHLTPSN